jgi:large subunit ribosomal protein L25
MKSITIQGTKRESVGKKSTKALRDAELVPCVVYGGEAPLNFSAEKSFKGLVYTPEAHTVSIEVDGQTIPAVLQDIQFHPITDKILHVDFYQLSDDKPVIMEVPVRITGRSKGVVAGGVLTSVFQKIESKSYPC